MDLFGCVILLVTFTWLFLSLRFLFFQKSYASHRYNLPPGKMGFPFIGESFEYFKLGRNGHPEKFILERMSKFCPQIFKTCILGEPTAVLCGISGNKFLFANENKLVTAWWPDSVHKVLNSKSDQNTSVEDSMKMRKLLPDFLNAEALKRYIGIMDSIAQQHFEACWEGRQQVTVFPLSRRFTFSLACKLFTSMEDTEKVTNFEGPFRDLASGLFSLPINLPGTPFNKAINASKLIREEIASIIKQRKMDLAQKKASPVQDILSHMLLTVDGEGQHISDSDITVYIFGLLFGGHDTASSVITLVVYYLAKHPEIYNRVYMEQMEIEKSKKPGELLNWNDIQKMKYSWNVACEVMRLAPPVVGTFRMAITDFNFAGFFIPKGWKLHWSTHATHKNPEYFPEPEKFDPSRFEGNGPIPYSYVPFGGGPRMCPGKEYARLEILVFMHNLIKRYKWEKLLPYEKITVNPLPIPVKGLPIRLFPIIRDEVSNFYERSRYKNEGKEPR